MKIHPVDYFTLALTVLVLNSLLLLPVQAGVWVTNNSMTMSERTIRRPCCLTARYWSWAGTAGSNVLASAELYDPATGNWTATGSLNIKRAYHTAALLPNGKVLIAGGINGLAVNGCLSSAELYDPSHRDMGDDGFAE